MKQSDCLFLSHTRLTLFNPSLPHTIILQTTIYSHPCTFNASTRHRSSIRRHVYSKRRLSRHHSFRLVFSPLRRRSCTLRFPLSCVRSSSRYVSEVCAWYHVTSRHRARMLTLSLRFPLSCVRSSSSHSSSFVIVLIIQSTLAFAHSPR